MSLCLFDIEEVYKKCKGLKPEDVERVKEWINLQPHLPKISDRQIILFLNSCYFSIEATKTCIDNFYTVRTLCPEFFTNQDPNLPDVTKAFKTILVAPLPKLTPKNELVYYYRLLDTNPDSYNLNDATKIFDMIVSMNLKEIGPVDGHLIISDMQGCTFAHMLKLHPVGLKKFMYYLQEALPFRLKGIHFVNAVSFMDKFLAFIKPFMKKELVEMLHVHEGDSISKFVPKECLPKNLGGSNPDIEIIYENYKKKVFANVEYFKEGEKLLVDESKRPEKAKTAGDFFGVEGTFKKLDID